MIKVTVELVSARGREYDRLLGIALISNEGVVESSPRFCRYKVWLSKWAPRERQAWKQGIVPLEKELTDGFEGEVERFDRNARGAWDLLYLGLKALVGGRNS